jgi:hypothetical protein
MTNQIMSMKFQGERPVKAILWISSFVTVVALGFVVTSPPVEAHHASGPFYDDTKSVEVLGEVTSFNFRNPHSFLFVRGENESGEMVDWEVEMGAAVSMSRNGWTRESIEAGDAIRVVGQPSRAPGTYGVCCARITTPDGSPIQLVRGEAGDTPLQMVALISRAED